VITLYQYEISPFCDKIRRTLNWKRLPYETRDVSIGETLFRLRKLNPIGKVPCIDADGTWVADSTHIARWLEERHPEPPLYPADARARALCLILEDWADESLYFFELEMRFGRGAETARWVESLTARDNFVVKQLARFAVPFTQRGITTKQGLGRKPAEMVERELAGHLDALAARLDGAPFLVGEALSIADIAVFAQLQAIRSTARGAGLIGAAAAPLRAWLDRVDTATAKRGV
jgi:glutathione S-transferase